jgi:hypothetical protein
MAVRRVANKSRRAPMGVAAAAKPRAERGKTASQETPLLLRTRGVEVDDELRGYIAKRAGFKLGKFAAAIEKTTVRLEDKDQGAEARLTRRCPQRPPFGVGGAHVDGTPSSAAVGSVRSRVKRRRAASIVLMRRTQF